MSADNGYRAIAVSLRGHGGSLTSKPLSACSIADYVDDVRAVSDSLSDEPVVVGHSMGGFIVQKYLESRDPPAGVRLSSVPPRGAFGPMLRLLRRHPWLCLRANVTMSSSALVNTSPLARRMFCSAGTPEVLVAEYAARVQDESARAASVDMLLLNRPRPERVRTPLLVLGAEEDGSISVPEVEATARALL